VAFFPGPVAAQLIRWPNVENPDLKPVYEMARPDYDAPGIGLDAFLLKPSLSNSVSYNDNIFASDVHKADDIVDTTSEEFEFTSLWPSDYLDIDLRSDQEFYVDHPGEDANSYEAHLEGRLDLSPTSSLELDAVGAQLPEQRADLVAIRNGKRPLYNEWESAVTYSDRIGKVIEQFRLAINQIAFIYPEEVYQSHTDKIIGDRVSLDEGGPLAPFLEVSYVRNDQVYHPSRQSFQNLTALAGIHAHISELIDAEFATGVLRETFRNPDFRPLVRPVVYGNLLWNIEPLTSVIASLLYDYSGVESFCNSGLVCQIGSDGNIEPVTDPHSAVGALFQTHRSTLQKAGLKLGIEHEIWHDLLGETGVEYDHNVFDLNNLIDDYFVFDIGLRYLVNRYAELQLSYQHRDRLANLPHDVTFNTGPYNENIAIVTIKAQL
jgi:hypothetical protein